MRDTTPIHARPWVTIPEACKLLRKNREWVKARMADGSFTCVEDGARMKIVTQSIRDWVERTTADARKRVGLA